MICAVNGSVFLYASPRPHLMPSSCVMKILSYFLFQEYFFVVKKKTKFGYKHKCYRPLRRTPPKPFIMISHSISQTFGLHCRLPANRVNKHQPDHNVQVIFFITRRAQLHTVHAKLSFCSSNLYDGSILFLCVYNI